MTRYDYKPSDPLSLSTGVLFFSDDHYPKEPVLKLSEHATLSEDDPVVRASVKLLYEKYKETRFSLMFRGPDGVGFLHVEMEDGE